MLYEWAMAYRKAGWVVLPAENKRPFLNEWKQYQLTKPTLQQTELWFDGAPDDKQIALITGEISGVTVVDIDVHKAGCPAKKGGVCNCDPDDPLTLALTLPLTIMSHTGSGGLHLFYRYDSICNSVGLVHPQMDIRSNGGIIILPPSLHESGRTYEWDDLVPWTYENLNNLAEFPALLKTQLIAKPKTDWLTLVDGAAIGGRNMAFTQLAGKLVHSFWGESLPAAWELLHLWNKYRCDPPQEQKDIEATWNSVCNLEKRNREKYDNR